MSEKQFLIVVVALGVLVLGVFGFLSYKDYARIREIKAESTQLDDMLKVHKKKIERIPELKGEVAKLESKFEDQRKILPEVRDVTNLIEVMTYLCERAKLENPRDVQPLAKKEAGPKRAPTGEIEAILYTFEITGSFFNFVQFLNYLEHYQRFLRVRDFSISGGGDRGRKGVVEGVATDLKFKITLITYRYRPTEGPEPKKQWLPIEEPRIPPLAVIKLQPPDPFVFSLVPVEVGPPAGPGPVGPVVPPGHEDFMKALADLQKRVRELSVEVIRQGASAPPDKLRKMVEEYNTCRAQVEALEKGAGVHGQEARTQLDNIKEDLKNVGARMKDIIKAFVLGEARRLKQELVALNEARRYREVLDPFLALVSETKTFERDASMDAELRPVLDEVVRALEQLVETEAAFKDVIEAHERLKKELKDIINKPTGAVFKVHLMDRIEKIRRKAEDIKKFLEKKILVKGAIWTPDAQWRVAIIILPQALADQKNPGRHIFWEKDRVGRAEPAEEAIVLDEVTPMKRVYFRYKGLRIPLPVGEERGGAPARPAAAPEPAGGR
ncbi:MAG: type 4a pilus biogenesis protein PilO [Planctomycetales bacterium]|nr:type 4a pilus biogenesis protein PilO [Planctomycetales bacterium]